MARFPGLFALPGLLQSLIYISDLAIYGFKARVIAWIPDDLVRQCHADF
jgi:hypothetical protein